MVAADRDEPGELHRLALTKMSAVLGPDRARVLMARLLGELRIVEVRTPDELYRLSVAMSRIGGFEGALGAMLGVTAVMRGATATDA